MLNHIVSCIIAACLLIVSVSANYRINQLEAKVAMCVAKGEK